MKIAIADIGSNTVKMTVFSEEGSVLYKKSSPVGLIGYIKNGMLTPEGIAVLSHTLARYQMIAVKEGADRLYPFATASLRAASNSSEVIEQIKAETTLAIDLVSGEEEAALSLDGISLSLGKPLDGGTLLDMGGGSCEIITPSENAAVSLPVGSLSLFVKFVKNLLPTKEELAAIYSYTETLAKEAGVGKREGEIYAVGGTLRAFCAFHAHIFKKAFSEKESYLITREEVCHLLSLVTEMKTDTKLTLLRLIPDRAHTFATGLTAITALLDLLGKDRVTVVAGGAREGYFLKIKNRLTSR